jgi:hypothetical protein
MSMQSRQQQALLHKRLQHMRKRTKILVALYSASQHIAVPLPEKMFNLDCDDAVRKRNAWAKTATVIRDSENFVFEATPSTKHPHGQELAVKVGACTFQNYQYLP